MKKNMIAGALSLALLAGTLGAGASGFPDVTDPDTAAATAILRQLGVVSGLPDGSYNPAGTFTRAEFCKMALTILGRESEAALQKGRVIFTDVTGSHWALGYINAAATTPTTEGAAALVQGKGNGTFGPNDPITAGEATAILIRALGFSDTDVAMAGAWYAGHMAKAETIGLLEGLEDLTGAETLTRGQAAELFENLLFVKGKNAKEVFLVSQLGGSITESQLILAVQSKALSGGGYALKTSKGTYKTNRDDLNTALKGSMCQLVLDKEDNVLALVKDEAYTTRSVRVLSAEGRYLVTAQQEQILVNPSTPVWRENAAQGTYGDLYAKDIPYGATAVLCYDDTETLTSLYLLGDSDSTITAVVGANGKLSGIVPDGDVTVYRNGLTSSLSALKPYDVVTYDPAAGILTATDNKLTGIYENAAPSPVSPDTVTVMGCEKIQVLDSALASIRQFQLGDRVTLLLDENNRVAAMVDTKLVEAETLGVATISGKTDSKDPSATVYTAQVTLNNGLVVKGEVKSSVVGAEKAPGKLVSVTSSEMGKLRLTYTEGKTAPGNWTVNKNKLGSLNVSPQAAVYERVGGSALKKLDMKDITLKTVPYGKISYYHQDASGTVDCMVLENVTGECFTYGLLTTFKAGSSGDDMYSFSNPTIVLENYDGQNSYVCGAEYEKYKGQYLGLAAALKDANGTPRVESLVVLQNAGSVRRNAFREDSVTVGGVSYPLSGDIDHLCYNAKSKTWFKSLDAALAYSSRLSVYYDKSPDQGGKIRLVVVE